MKNSMYEIGFSYDDSIFPVDHLCEYLRKDNEIVYHTPVGQILSTILGIRKREYLSALLADLSNDIDQRLKRMIMDYIESYQNNDSICRDSRMLNYLFYEYAPNAFTYENTSRRCLKKNDAYSGINEHIPDFFESITVYDGICYYPVNTFSECCILTLLYVVKNGHHFNRCQNCADYFIPAKRCDAIYCDAPAIQDQTMTCKEYGSKYLWREKRNLHPSLKVYDSVYATKNNRVKRSHGTPSHQAYVDNFERFKREAEAWKKHLAYGKCTDEEFITWLNEQKGKKT